MRPGSSIPHLEAMSQYSRDLRYSYSALNMIDTKSYFKQEKHFSRMSYLKMNFLLNVTLHSS